MKGSIKYSHLGFIRKDFLAYLDSHKVSWIVQRGQVNTVSDSPDNLIIDSCCFYKLFTAVDNAMPNRVKVITLNLLSLKIVQDFLQGFLMIGPGNFLLKKVLS